MFTAEEYDAAEPGWLFRQDADFGGWLARLDALPSSGATIRSASPTPADARRIKDLQIVCEPLTVETVRSNAATIGDKTVLIAEIGDVHVGYLVSHPAAAPADPLFVQVVAVAPAAQRRGIGAVLLTAAAAREPERDIVLATQEQNVAMHALNRRFADSLGAGLERIALGTFRDGDLGIRRGLGYRAWRFRRRAGGW